MKRLNGWQRLWVVLSIIYLLVVVGSTFALFPKASEVSNARVYDSINAVGRFREANEGSRFQGAYTVRADDYFDLSDEQIIKRLHEKWGDKVDFTKIELEYKQKMQNLS